MEDLCRTLTMSITPPVYPPHYTAKVVSSLPPTGEEGTVYIVDRVGFTYNNGWTPENANEKEY